MNISVGEASECKVLVGEGSEGKEEVVSGLCGCALDVMGGGSGRRVSGVFFRCSPAVCGYGDCWGAGGEGGGPA